MFFIRNIIGAFLIVFFIMGVVFAKPEINTDISKYNEYMGENAKEEYRTKWGMNEEIFPQSITDNMNVSDYKMVYYNPWDAQFLSYLVVDYNKDNYEKEIQRLKEYNSTNYIGYYGVTGFSKYRLLAMEADAYYGFIYALTDGEERIIYVELIFCNYFYDLEYNKYININYLPDGFDATLDNSYERRMMQNKW